MIPKIPGILLTDPTEIYNVRQDVSDWLQVDFNTKKFPGAQPISFAAKHKQELMEEGYFVSEKADGVRCLFYTRQIVNDFDDRVKEVESYLIDRKNNYYQLKIGLPLPGLKAPHRHTILDGELVYETVKGKQELFFLFFDCLLVDEKLLIEKNYMSRLGYLRDMVIKPYKISCDTRAGYAARLPFKLSQKRVEFSYDLRLVFELMKKYGHKTDGLMFTSVNAPYTLGTSQKMLKWKPADENTVDFKVRQIGEQEFDIEILKHDRVHERIGQLLVDEETLERWNKDSTILDGRIVECSYENGRWKFARFRDDKPSANHISVYEKIVESIEDNVTKEELLELAPDIYENWKARDPKIKPMKDLPPVKSS